MARLRCAVASLLLVGLHASVLRRPQPTTPGRLALEPLMHLRGGGDATADLKLADDPPTAEPVSCWSAVQKLLGFLRKMLVPNHEHAKAEQRGIAEETPEQSTGYAPDDDSWRTQRKKLNQVELPPAARKRVLRDLRRMKAHDDELLSLEDSECLTDWVIKLVGAPGTVFDGEIYRLRIRMHADYPTRPPTVVFMRPAPMYEHVYSNGMVCLDLLGSAWDPKLDVLGICLSIQSMLSSAKKKGRPPDNEVTSVMAKGQDARDMAWHPHDDEC
jgi:ubiquitin-conjugating enzyme E2 W